MPTMNEALPPADEILRHLTVRDIMNPEVISVRPSLPVPELLALLVERHIGGVPVVSDAGRLLGVVAATDVLRLASFTGDLESRPDASDGEADGGRGRFFLEDAATPPSASDAAPALDGWVVADIMTPTAFTISPDASLADLARTLFRAEIHRAVVTRNDHLVGIVTTFDLARAVAATQDE